MTISTIRKYTDEDKARVKVAAERFCARHGISYYADDDEAAAEYAIECEICDRNSEADQYLRKLWTACYCRALRVKTDVRVTTGYDYIGVRVD